MAVKSDMPGRRLSAFCFFQLKYLFWERDIQEFFFLLLCITFFVLFFVTHCDICLLLKIIKEFPAFFFTK